MQLLRHRDCMKVPRALSTAIRSAINKRAINDLTDTNTLILFYVKAVKYLPSNLNK